ncbi:hypothetical protein ACJIZ3_003828 [Penstemon smallii]|uniref:Uncharacterized protein n=1 Tax=Penstemon smallii TaxID=265156 RepID=A0ABD3S0C7_9LAMI
MKAVLFRTGSGSIPIHTPPSTGSNQISSSLPVHDSTAGVFPGVTPKKMSLNMNMRRSSSETDVIRIEAKALTKIGSLSFPATPRIPEEDWAPANGRTWEDVGFPGGGMNKNWNSGSGGGGGYDGDEGGDNCEIGAYYQEMVKSDPTNCLLLRNYGKYLHEVEKDVVKAEEYYCRAILGGPGDGEVLSLYGKLIWETQRDQNRAKSYFHQAIHASPHDCMVLGSYAHFLWEAEEEEEDQEKDLSSNEQIVSNATLIQVF